jgi:hypothetical protein
MNAICQNNTYLCDNTIQYMVVYNKMRLLIRLEPKAYFTSYISQI